MEVKADGDSCRDLWDLMLGRWAPNSRYYYYAEELALEVTWTHNVYRKSSATS